MKITSRRSFLGASAGAALLPLLRSVRAGAAGEGPKYFINVFTPYGVNHREWYPTGGEVGFTLGRTSMPLEKHRSDLLIFSNLHNLVGEASQCENGTDQHVAGVTSLWTGAFAKDLGTGSTKRILNGPSLDQLIAEHMAKTTSLAKRSAQLGVLADTVPMKSECYTSRTTDGQILKPIDSPATAFAGLFAGGVKTVDVQRTVDLDRSLLDQVAADIRAFEGGLASDERQRFQAHVGAFRSLETKLSAAVMAPAGTGCAQPPTADRFATAMHLSPKNFWKVAGVQSDLATLALACDVTRVVSLNWYTGYSRFVVPATVHPEIGEREVEGHDLSHDGPSNAYKHRTNLEYAHCDQFAALLDRLKATPSRFGGSVFDHAVVAWTSCLSGNGGGGHSKMKIPFVLAAGKRAGFATGRHVDAGGRSHTMILLSLAHAFGLTLDTIGMSRFCPGPMPGLTAAGPLPPFTRPTLRVCH